MKIQIYSISQEGKRGDKESYTPNSSDIFNSQGLIEIYLLKNGYRPGIGTLQVQSQGFGRGVPYTHTPFSASHILIDSCIYFNPENDSSVLEVSLALDPERLEAIVREIMRESGLPEKKWNRSDFGLIEVSDGFPRNPDKICVRNITRIIKGKSVKIAATDIKAPCF